MAMRGTRPGRRDAVTVRGDRGADAGTDWWWAYPLATRRAAGVDYATYAAVATATIGAILSPFYSRCLSLQWDDAWSHGVLGWLGTWWIITAVTSDLPAGVPADCYYYRKANYRSWLSRPSPLPGLGVIRHAAGHVPAGCRRSGTALREQQGLGLQHQGLHGGLEPNRRSPTIRSSPMKRRAAGQR
jgi:hypothetical protein